MDDNSKYYKKVNKYLLIFLAAIFFTYFCYMIMYTNYYIGHDGSRFRNFDVTRDIVSGRFFGTYSKALHNFLQAPWMVGFISSCFMGLASVYLVKTLRIRSMFWACAIVCCMISWPSYIAGHNFLYMLSQFSVAIFTSILSAYFLEKEKWGIVLSIAFLVISLGNYQAYIGFTACLFLIRIIEKCYSGEDLKSLFIYILKALFVLIAGVAVYFLLWQTILNINGLERQSYRQMDRPVKVLIKEAIYGIKDVYLYVWHWFTDDPPSYFPKFLNNAALVLYAVLAIVILIVTVKRTKGLWPKILRLLILLGTFGVLPIAMDGAHFIDPGLEPHALMMGAMITPLFLLVVFMDKITDRGKIYRRAFSYIVAGLVCAFIINDMIVANTLFLRFRANQYRAESELAGVIARINAEPDYHLDTPVAFVRGKNNLSESIVHDGFECLDDFPGVYFSITTVNALRNHVLQMVPKLNFVSADPYTRMKEVRALEEYPAHNCLTWIDGTLVIKIPR